MTAPISLPELRWVADLQRTTYHQQLKDYWLGNGPRPGKTLEPVLHIEDLDPRRAQQADFAANGWSTQR